MVPSVCDCCGTNRKSGSYSRNARATAAPSEPCSATTRPLSFSERYIRLLGLVGGLEVVQFHDRVALDDPKLHTVEQVRFLRHRAVEAAEHRTVILQERRTSLVAVELEAVFVDEPDGLLLHRRLLDDRERPVSTLVADPG